MREFELRKGKFAGKHRIYDNPKECEECEGIVPKPWKDLNNQPGDWVICDDGFVCQLLHRYDMPDERKTTVFRFPFISRPVYYRKSDDSWVFPCLYTYLTNSSKNSLVSIGYSRVLGGSLNKKKILWSTLVINGVDPSLATKQVYQTPKKSTTDRLTLKLLTDEKVSKYMAKKVNSFKEELEELASREGMSFEQYSANKIMEALTTKGRSVKDLISQAKLSFEVLRLINDPKEKLKNASEADIIEPPAI